MKIVVKIFKPRFAPLVEAGLKLQTVRPRPKRPRDLPERGDVISAREWTGKPYRSKQRLLCEGRITNVQDVALDRFGAFVVGGEVLHPTLKELFAHRDGFESFSEMYFWFEKEHGLPFVGIFILWEIKYQPKAANV